MLKKTASGWQVVSEQGKPLSKDDLTRVEAEERLKEVEKFKEMNKSVEDLKKWAAKRR